MAPPRPVVTIAPLLFVFAPDGQVETLAGFPFDPDGLVRSGTMQIGAADPARGAAAALDRVLAAEIARQLRDLPGLAITSRLRPLVPRLAPPARIVLPMWAIARIDLDGVEGDLWMERARRHPYGLGAAARLARLVEDPDLEREAEGEFRRALAGDPMANRLMGEDARMRALSVDELARAGRHGEAPPVLAMLPRLFTIDELRLAVARITRVPEERVESSSNFRRRVQELLGHGVLRPVGEAARGWAKSSPVVHDEVGGGTRPGRSPTLYEFDEVRWRRWLLHRAGGAEEVARREIAPLMREMRAMAQSDEAPWESRAAPEGMRGMRPDPIRMVASRMRKAGSRARSPRESDSMAGPVDSMAESVESMAAFALELPRDDDPADDARASEMVAASMSPPESPVISAPAAAAEPPALDGILAALRAAEARLAESERRLSAERDEVQRALSGLREARTRAESGGEARDGRGRGADRPD